MTNPMGLVPYLALLNSAVNAQFRPPAVPLIANDPYFSVWSVTDRLADGVTRHWTGAEQPLTSFARIDGHPYRLMGLSDAVPDEMPQEGLQITPTQSKYAFAGAGVEIHLTFTTPLLPDDIDVLSRPATYVTWTVRAADGKSHEVEVFFSADARLCVNKPDQLVATGRLRGAELTVLSIGSVEQPVLQKRGDDLRIDWGHLLLAAHGPGYLGPAHPAFERFAQHGALPGDAHGKPHSASENTVAAIVLPFGRVAETPISHHVIVAYDDEYSVQFMGHNLRPYWRRHGLDSIGLIHACEHDHADLLARCDAFDREVMADTERIGGRAYADIASLAYRQSIAAQKVVADANGQPLMFSKENFSNGCMATVDVLYPASPLLLAFSPTLTKASLVPILDYAASPRWKWPFAPHDLGTYPKANGQVYGGGERTEDDQMPVEESGNMLLILAALAEIEGNADFSAPYWPQLEKWAAYLADKGFDPERQLSTDDFAGHLAHNVNLSAKAIEALGAYAYLADRLGKTDEAHKYHALAKSFADRWVTEGKEGDHYRLAFDRPDTWSQKYNLVWDRLLGLNLFPASVAETELAFYRTKLNAYGLPLDNRADYTKLDWIVWTATLTTNEDDFRALVDPIAKFLNDTPDRVPMTDWYMTSEPRHRGFQARSVVGGVFIKLLADRELWRKYAMRDQTPVGGWAALPIPPEYVEVVPTAAHEVTNWAYTMTEPPTGWEQPNFDASSWKVGPGGFGHGPEPGAPIRTTWDTHDIWLRREFTLPAEHIGDIHLKIQHDDDADVYINGVFAIHLPGAEHFDVFEISKAARNALRPGKNLLAIHVQDTGGDSYIDAGFVRHKSR